MMTTSKFFGLSLEILEDWVNALGVKAANVVIGSDVESIIPTNYSVCYFKNDFSGRLLKCISTLEVDLVLVILDDYKLLTLDLDKLSKGLSDFYILKSSALKLVPNPYPDIFIPGNLSYGICSAHTHWRINSQPTIFQKEFLYEILRPSESIWDFEVNSSIRSSAIPCNIMSPMNSIANYREIIKGGKILSQYYDLYGVRFGIERISLFKSFIIVIEAKFKKFIIEIIGYSLTRKIKILISFPFKIMK